MRRKSQQRPPVIVILGPTAAGKTALAMQLADRLPLKLISVDSAMVYRGLDIGTGKPTAQELERYPHALINIAEPTEHYNAARFVQDASWAINAAHAQNKIPCLVGGTILYIRALLQGLTATPSAQPELRAQIQAHARSFGWPAVHVWLTKLDPMTGARLNPNDRQRLERALEVCLATGRPFHELYDANYFRAGWDQQALQDSAWNITLLGLAPQHKADLHPLIERRFDDMLNQGLITEVEQLFNSDDINAELPAIRAVGYRQVWSYLEQSVSFNTMREQALAATRQLAKRQLTWMRSFSQLNYLDCFCANLINETTALLNSASLSDQ